MTVRTGSYAKIKFPPTIGHDPRLEEELLYDAQVSIWKENCRRAVLEMALALEVMVKRKYFGGNDAVGAAFEHLEAKGKVNVRVVDLLHSTARDVYGESFRETNPSLPTSLRHRPPLELL